MFRFRFLVAGVASLAVALGALAFAPPDPASACTASGGWSIAPCGVIAASPPGPSTAWDTRPAPAPWAFWTYGRRHNAWERCIAYRPTAPELCGPEPTLFGP